MRACKHTHMHMQVLASPYFGTQLVWINKQLSSLPTMDAGDKEAFFLKLSGTLVKAASERDCMRHALRHADLSLHALRHAGGMLVTRPIACGMH